MISLKYGSVRVCSEGGLYLGSGISTIAARNATGSMHGARHLSSGTAPKGRGSRRSRGMTWHRKPVRRRCRCFQNTHNQGSHPEICHRKTSCTPTSIGTVGPVWLAGWHLLSPSPRSALVHRFSQFQQCGGNQTLSLHPCSAKRKEARRETQSQETSGVGSTVTPQRPLQNVPPNRRSSG